MPYIDRYLLQVIQQQGVAESHLDALRFEGTAAMLKAATQLSQTLPELPTALPQTAPAQPYSQPQPRGSVSNFSEHCVHADSAQIAMHFPEILHWGLGDRILSLAESILGCPPALIGTALRKDNPNGQQSGTRLWHLDGEDPRVFKIFVYLNDVTPDNGPFEYVPKSCFDPAYRRFSLRHRRFWQDPCRDSDLAQIVPPEQWRAATGPAGTILLSDTASVFHHGAIARSGERLMLIFAYTSQQPKARALAEQFFPAAQQLLSLAPRLSARQRNCLFAWRGWEAEAEGQSRPTHRPGLQTQG